MAPQKIENMLKLQKHIAYPVVVGDRQKFLTALIGIEREAFDDLNGGDGMQGDFKTMAASPRVQELVAKEVEEVNKQLASFETIKKFYIVPDEFSVDNGLITPSLKVKKKRVINAYQGEIERMYHQ